MIAGSISRQTVLTTWHRFKGQMPVIRTYGTAAAAVLIVESVRMAVLDEIPPWLLFAPTIVGLTLVLGIGAGIWSTIIAIVLASISSITIYLIETPLPIQRHTIAIYATTVITFAIVIALLAKALLQSNGRRKHLANAISEAAEREAFLRSVLSSSSDRLKVLELDGKPVFNENSINYPPDVEIFGKDLESSWLDTWLDSSYGEAVAAVQDAREGRTSNFVGRTKGAKGATHWCHVAVSPITDLNGKPYRILAVSRDITALRESEEGRNRFVRLAENSADFIGMTAVDGQMVYMNSAARELVGLEEKDISNFHIADFFGSEEAQSIVGEILPTVAKDGHWVGELSFRHFHTGESIPVLYSVFPLTDPDGNFLGYGTVTRDFRSRKRAEEDLRMMNGELAHRLKNVLAVIQSVALQTLRNATDLPSASHNLTARLVALGAASDVLTNASWRCADLRTLAVHALSPHGDLGTRIILDGPPVTLQPQVAMALALALHELATNAAKYGALSNDTGCVRLDWRISGSGPEARFHLTWCEQGGPPVSKPAHRGFGSTLIERSLRSYFNGTAVTEFSPAGVKFSLAARMDDAAIINRKH